MEPGIANTLIAAGSVLGGIIVSGAIGLIGFYIKTSQDVKKLVQTKHFDHRFGVYSKTLDFASKFYQGGIQTDTKAVQDLNKDLILVASPEVYRAFNNIFDTSPDKLKRKNANITDEQIKEIQTKASKEISISIRRSLYPDQEDLPIEEIRFIAEKKTNQSK